jgi:hypothetical protein
MMTQCPSPVLVACLLDLSESGRKQNSVHHDALVQDPDGSSTIRFWPPGTQDCLTGADIN